MRQWTAMHNVGKEYDFPPSHTSVILILKFCHKAYNHTQNLPKPEFRSLKLFPSSPTNGPH